MPMNASRWAYAGRADRLAGPLVTATAVLSVNAFSDGEFVAHPLYLACVVYSVFRGGMTAGLASTAIVVGDVLIRALAVPFGLHDPFRQINMVALACLVVVLVTGHLKRRADHASELSRANEQLTGQLIDRTRSEEAALTLAALTRGLIAPLDVTHVHQHIVSTILELFRAREARLYWLDPASQELVCVAAAGDADDRRWVGERMPAGEGIAGQAIREHRLCVSSIADAERWLALPLRARGKVLGALTFSVTPGRAVADSDVQLLSIFAGHAALALENSQLLDDLRTTLARLGDAQARLVDDARLRATEEVAAGVAHHVNNRLMVILTGVQLLMEKLSGDDHHRRSLEIVERTTLDTARLIARLRQFALGRPRATAESADVNLAVQRAVEMCGPDWSEASARGVTADLVLQLGQVPRVVGDEPMLEEALAHVLRNAIEAVPADGTITIATSTVGPHVLCTVADTGAGMPDDVVSLAVEPFFTTKGPQRAGLGLSSALGIMRQLGGHLDLASELDVGTRVTLRLRAWVG
jgi:signal transduction histidine kinase